jgi:hypothetical protein
MLLGGWRSRAMLDRYARRRLLSERPMLTAGCRWAIASDWEQPEECAVRSGGFAGPARPFLTESGVSHLARV